MAPHLRKLSLFGFGLLLTAIILLVFAPQFVPSEIYKDQVIHNIESATGRQVEIKGDIGLRFIPRVELVMSKVRMGNPAGFDESTNMLTLDELQLSLGFLPLLRGELDVQTLRLINPVLSLARNAKGKPNWELSPEEPIEKTMAEAEEKKKGGRRTVKMPEMEIINGTVTYQAKPDAELVSLAQLNMKVKVPSLDDQLTIYADTRLYNRLLATLEIRLNTPADWLEGRETAYTVELRLDKDLMKLAAEGKANPRPDSGKTPNVQGSVHLAARSLPELAKALEQPALARIPEPGKLSLRTMFNWQDQKAALRGTTLSLDETTLSGSGMFDLAGKRPSIALELISTDTLVLSGLTAKPEGQQPISRTEDASTSGWDKEPLITDNTFLSAADADISLKMGGLKMDNVTLGTFQANAHLLNGVLKFSIPEAAFYGGKGQISGEIGASGKTGLRISQSLQLSDANIGLFLRDAFAFDRLDGVGNLKVNINTRGDSQYDFVNNLGGNGSLSLENGAIRGFNLAETVRNVRSFVASVKNPDIAAEMQSTDDAVKTDFSRFSGSFTIDRGTLTNPDLALKAPLLDTTGKGTVNIPQKTVDYRLRPTLVGSLEGEGRTQQTSGGLTIPLRVTGTFDQLKFTPDAESAVEKLLTDPEGGIKDLEKNVKGLRDDVKSLFKGL